MQPGGHPRGDCDGTSIAAHASLNHTLCSRSGSYPARSAVCEGGGGREAATSDAALGRQDNRTPLHIAAQQGHLKIVQKLVEEDANINAKDKVSTQQLRRRCRSV